jgi:hypothetical protein
VEERINGGAVKDERSPLKEAIDFKVTQYLVGVTELPLKEVCFRRNVVTYLEEA